MTCSVRHDGVQQFSFDCDSDNANSSLQHVRCDNNTFNATHMLKYEGISTFNVMCTATDDVLIVFNKTVSISITPSQVDIAHSSYENNSITIYFGQFDDVEAISTVIINETDVDRNLLQQDVLLNVTFDRTNKLCLLDYTFKENGRYVIALTFQNGHYFYVIEKDLILARLHVESTKKLNLSPDASKFDALYSLSFQAIFENVHTEYEYHWKILEELETTKTDQIIKKLPAFGDCYDFHLNVSNDNSILAIAISSICVEVGVNVSLDYKKGVMLGDHTTFTLNVDQMGPDSCLMLEIIGSNTTNIFQKLLDKSTCNTTGALTTNDDIVIHNLVSQSDGRFVGIIDYLFEQEGEYEIRLTAKNSVTSQTDSVIVDVVNLKCRSPEIEIIGKTLVFLLYHYIIKINIIFIIHGTYILPIKQAILLPKNKVYKT